MTNGILILILRLTRQRHTHVIIQLFVPLICIGAAKSAVFMRQITILRKGRDYRGTVSFEGDPRKLIALWHNEFQLSCCKRAVKYVTSFLKSKVLMYGRTIRRASSISLPSPYACMLATCVVKKKTQATYAVLHLHNMEN